MSGSLSSNGGSPDGGPPIPPADLPSGPWQVPRFRAYAGMRLFWGMAQAILTVALGWTIFQRTGSTLALGFVGLASFLPSILLALVTGVAADRLDRRHIMLASAGTMTLCALVLALIMESGPLPAVYAVVVVQGVARAFAAPASKAMVPNIAPPGMLSRTIAASSLVQGFSTIAGPAIGGALLPLGAPVPFLVSAGLAALAMAGAAGLGVQRARGVPSARPGLAEVFEGFVFIGRRPAILGAMLLDLVAVLFGSANALLPYYVTEVFHEGAWAMGALRTTEAVGSLLMAAFLTRHPIQRHVGPRLLVAVGVYGLATIAFGLSTEVVAGLACMAVLGASDTVSMVLRNAMIQVDTPDRMQGRVAAVHSVTVGASNDLGEFESGVLAHAIGAVPAVVVGGTLATLAAVSWGWIFPAVRRTDRLDERLPEN